MPVSKYPNGFHKLIIAILVLTTGLIFIPNLINTRIWDDFWDGEQFTLGPRIINIYYLEASKTFVSFSDGPIEGTVTLKHLDTGSLFNFSFLLEPSSIYIETRRNVEYFVLPLGQYNVSINVVYGIGASIRLFTFGIIPEDYLLIIYLIFFGLVFFLFYNAYKEDPDYYKHFKKNRTQLKEDLRRSNLPLEISDEQKARLEHFIIDFLIKNKGRAFSFKRLQDRLTEESNDSELYWQIKKNLKSSLEQLVNNNSISSNIHKGIQFYLIPP